jgi:hypothetical protein
VVRNHKDRKKAILTAIHIIKKGRHMPEPEHSSESALKLLLQRLREYKSSDPVDTEYRVPDKIVEKNPFSVKLNNIIEPNISALGLKIFKFVGNGPFMELDLQHLLPDNAVVVHSSSDEPVDYLVIGLDSDEGDISQLLASHSSVIRLNQAEFLNLILFGKRITAWSQSASVAPQSLTVIATNSKLHDQFESIEEAKRQARLEGRKMVTILGYSSKLSQKKRRSLLDLFVVHGGGDQAVLDIRNLLQIRLNTTGGEQKFVKAIDSWNADLEYLSNKHNLH